MTSKDNRSRKAAVAGLLCLSLAAVVTAQTRPGQLSPTPPAAVPAANGPGQATGQGMVTIRNSPQGRAIYDDVRGIARMTRDVRVTQAGEDFILYADELTYNRPQNRAYATQKLRVETRNSTLRGDRLIADFNSRTLTLIGNVTISSHGEKDGIAPATKGIQAELRHKPSQLLCERADWDYEVRQGVATGNIRMIQADNRGTCRKLTFDEDKNIAHLDGEVRFSDGKRRTLLCNDLTVYIDSDKVESRQPCTINFPRDNSTAATAAPTKAPPAQFGPPPEISEEDLQGFTLPGESAPGTRSPAAPAKSEEKKPPEPATAAPRGTDGKTPQP